MEMPGGSPKPAQPTKALSEDASIAAGLAAWMYRRLNRKYKGLLGGSQFTGEDRQRVELANGQILAWTHANLVKIVQYPGVARYTVGVSRPITILDVILKVFPGPQRGFPYVAKCYRNCSCDVCAGIVQVVECVLRDWFSLLSILMDADLSLMSIDEVWNFGRRVYQTDVLCDPEVLNWVRQWAWVRGSASQMAAAQLFNEPEDPVLKHWFT